MVSPQQSVPTHCLFFVHLGRLCPSFLLGSLLRDLLSHHDRTGMGFVSSEFGIDAVFDGLDGELLLALIPLSANPEVENELSWW
jgi:hypothetical protein